MSPPDSSETRSTLAHDLRGPLITIQGFVGEIDEALVELETLLDEGAEAEIVARRLAALLAADIRPCLGFVETAVSSMHDRIDALRPTSTDASDG